MKKTVFSTTKWSTSFDTVTVVSHRTYWATHFAHLDLRLYLQLKLPALPWCSSVHLLWSLWPSYNKRNTMTWRVWFLNSSLSKISTTHIAQPNCMFCFTSMFLIKMRKLHFHMFIKTKDTIEYLQALWLKSSSELVTVIANYVRSACFLLTLWVLNLYAW